ncbi:FAD-dependent oxidoreductase [Actinotalea sp. BY-33]|uniref:FAD-dependent oxidoreductase n=1 Tax=Actinotalea soli TaxID=2819234 RepID=A0A939LR26_9CELL|nr:FAD-dependent oxidoreductase [Actinotalea soli]
MRILIIGGGYTGFYTAWRLEKRLHPREAEVTVVDPRGYMTYQPFLPEVMAGSVEARHAIVSLRSHLRRTRIIAGHATSIDHAHRTVTVHTGDTAPQAIEYDILVVTAGAVTRTLPIPGLAEQAIGLKQVEEAVWIRDRLLTAFDEAAALPSGPARTRALTVTVVGGGFTGVEAFGELLSLATSLLRSYPEIAFSDLSFHLIEAQARILPEVTDGPGRWVVRHLEQRGAHIHTESQVTSVRGGHIELAAGETFDTNLLIWAVGNGSNPVIARHTDLPVDDRGLLRVRADLRVGTDAALVPDAWGAGDNAAVPDLSSAAPGALTVPNAQHAVRQGKHLADNLVAHLRGKAVRPYSHRSLGTVATLGMHEGVFQYRRLIIKGLVAWLMHRGYHVLAIPTWERKLRVLLVWLSAALFGRDIVALRGVEEPRAAFLAAGDPDVLRSRHKHIGAETDAGEHELSGADRAR